MSTPSHPPFDSPLQLELQPLRDHWLLLLILGIGMTLLGTMAIISSFIFTLATVAFFGTMLFLGAVLQVLNAVTCREWRGFVINLLVGIVYGVIGMIMMSHPIEAAAGITLMLAAAFMVGGAVRIVAAAAERFQGWPWVLLNGFISLFLGIFIWRHFPGDSFWVIGVFVGVDLIFCGWTWIFLALGIRSAFPKRI
jgi:uncharacterized membrane protein HdeD (DUF308 family)